MKGMRKKIIVLTVAAAAGAMSVWLYRRYSIPAYELIDLGSLGGDYGFAAGINNCGQVVGWSEIQDGNEHAFIWDAKKKMRELEGLGGRPSQAHDINDKGQIVGCLKNTDGFYHAFIWDPNTGMTDLGTLGGESSAATEINAKGQVVGYAKTKEGMNRAFFWSPTDGMRALGTLYGGSNYAYDINEKGQVVGAEFFPLPGDPSKRFHRAFVWDKSAGMIIIAAGHGQNSQAIGINDAGQVVGYVSEPEIHSSTAFLWEREKGLTELNLSNVESSAEKINNAGEILGRLTTGKVLFYESESYLFLRTSSGRIVNLNSYVGP